MRTFENFDIFDHFTILIFFTSEIRDKKTLTAIKTITGGILNSCDVSYADHLRLEHIDTYNPMLEHIVRATNWLCKLEKVKKSKICTTSAKVQYLTNIYWTSWEGGDELNRQQGHQNKLFFSFFFLIDWISYMTNLLWKVTKCWSFTHFLNLFAAFTGHTATNPFWPKFSRKLANLTLNPLIYI